MQFNVFSCRSGILRFTAVIYCYLKSFQFICKLTLPGVPRLPLSPPIPNSGQLGTTILQSHILNNKKVTSKGYCCGIQKEEHQYPFSLSF